MFKAKLNDSVKDTALAAKLPKDELRLLDKVATLIKVDASQEIISQATSGRSCFVVVDGEFAVAGPGVASSIGSGDVAGELALLTGKRRNASVTATTDAKVYAMKPRDFATFMSSAPTFRDQVLESASERLGPDETVSLPAQFVGLR